MFSKRALVVFLAAFGYGGMSVVGAAPTLSKSAAAAPAGSSTKHLVAVSDNPHLNQYTETDAFF